ncbi:MAG: 2Fe-2S iron-sulfur cluster-binding protein [Roseburia inulinivorans]
MKRIFLQKKQNKTILELLREQGEYLDAPCSGKGTCGKCCIIIEETRKTDPPKQREKEVFTERELEEGWRLSCMTVPTDDLYVCIPEIRENQIQVQMEFVRNTKMESDVQATTVICENKIEDRAQIGSDGEIKPENMDTEKSVYGIAIDIGTTTLAARTDFPHRWNMLKNCIFC